MAFGLPRVPGIDVSAIRVGVIGAVQYAFWERLSNPLTWGIYEPGTDTVAIEVDSVISMSKTGNSDVSRYPIVSGSFTSYNKVNQSDEYRIRLAKGGNPAIRKAFSDWLQKNKESPTLFDIATPETTYSNVSLTNYEIRRDVRDGTVTMIIADCVFVEVRETPAVYYKASEGKANTTHAQQPQDTPTKEGKFTNPIEYVAKGAREAFNNVVGTVIDIQQQAIDIVTGKKPFPDLKLPDIKR